MTSVPGIRGITTWSSQGPRLYIRSEDGRTFGLTAGHVARKFLIPAKVSTEAVELTSPSEDDAQFGKLHANLWMSSCNLDYKIALQAAKPVVKAAKRDLGNPELQRDVEEARKKLATELMSVVDVTKFINDEVTKAGWQRNIDWGLLQPEAARIGNNAVMFADRPVCLEKIGAMAPGTLVVKKGRSTGRPQFGDVRRAASGRLVTNEVRQGVQWWQRGPLGGEVTARWTARGCSSGEGH
ncbi:hypothetical protein ABW21_db0200412 [Orbilia brochopaga]|nr:hypothetical protein ABW21_db0200412 [Drechslerella brochopaga]